MSKLAKLLIPTEHRSNNKFHLSVKGKHVLGKIQGDGRKFLHRFKSYFGSQISSQSLNEIRIYRLQPKCATKGEFFFIYFCF